MAERNAGIALVVVDLFAAVSAIIGAVGLLVGYMNIPLSVLGGTPFADFTVSALLLGGIVGGSALAALAALIWLHRIEVLVSAAAGCIIVGWMTVEVAMIGLVIWVQAAYFVVGLVMIGLAGLLELAESHQTSGNSFHQPESKRKVPKGMTLSCDDCEFSKATCERSER